MSRAKKICADINIQKRCYCTLPTGHHGKHVAIGIAGQFCSEWENRVRDESVCGGDRGSNRCYASLWQKYIVKL
jgi:hypothetical protein